MARKWFVLLAILVGAGVLALAGIAYFVSSRVAVSQELHAADSVLESTRQHNNKIATALQDPKLDSVVGSSQDLTKTKVAIGTYVARLRDSASTIEADLHSLRQADDRLKSQPSSPLMWLNRSELAAERDRVESVMSALDSADAFVKIAQGQMQTFLSLVDTFAAFQALTPYLERVDAAGALSLYPELEKRLQTTAELSRGPNTAPQLQTEVGNFQITTQDLKTFLEAIQAKDFERAQALQPKIDADAKALETFDQKGFDDYEAALAKPYRDRFDAGIKRAGFTVTD